jgi:hypothetical protein
MKKIREWQQNLQNPRTTKSFYHRKKIKNIPINLPMIIGSSRKYVPNPLSRQLVFAENGKRVNTVC